MAMQHGGAIELKPIEEVIKYKKSLIPADIPESYPLKTMFAEVSDAKTIESGVIAFRDFLHKLLDFIAASESLYAAPPKSPKSIDDYPFLHYLSNLLIDIGYYGKLTANGDSLFLTGIPSFSVSIDDKGKVSKPKISIVNQIECLRLLTVCGFVFSGFAPRATSLKITDDNYMIASFPSAPSLPAGLKALAIAEKELRSRRYWNDNHMLRCDYRLLKSEESDMLDVIMDILHPLSEGVRKFAANLHRRYVDMGMTCVEITDNQNHYSYSFVKNSKRALTPRDIYYLRIWEFSYTLRHGYCLVIRAKKTDKYADVIKEFPASLQNLIARGYGCDIKLHNERCQGGCQGYRIPLDDSILSMSEHIKTWIDNEARRSMP